MAFDDGSFRSRMVGDLNLSPDDGPDEPTAMLLELNVLFPGGLHAVRREFFALWATDAQRWTDAPLPASGTGADARAALLRPAIRW